MMLLVSLITAAAPQAGAALTLGEVRRARDEVAARALAPRVLPPAIAPTVVTATVRRRWLPGQAWWLGFRDSPRAIDADLCERTGYSVEASGGQWTAEDAPDGTALVLGERARWTEIAVLQRGRRASAAACKDAAFVAAERDRERVIAAYRVLVAAMAAAKGERPLPFAITCDVNDVACADPRRALATLPLAALGAINVSCLAADKRPEERGGFTFLSCAAGGKGRPYQAEVAFGMSAPDGRSWRVGFVHRPGWPATIALSRPMVTYH